MAKFWSSPNRCGYVPDEVWLKVEIVKPVPEPDFDIIMEKLNEAVRYYAIDEGGVLGKRYRIDEDELEYEDNPTVLINGLMYVTYTGTIELFCMCEDGKDEDLEADVLNVLAPCEGRIVSKEVHGCY